MKFTKKYPFYFLPLTALLLISCAAQQPILVKRIPFPVEEYEALPKTGTGEVVGQAFLKTRGGDVKTCAGEEVTLNPVTSYSDQWYEVSYIGQKQIDVCHGYLPLYIITKTADADGRFHFKDVPPGEYYITTRVIWQIPGGYHNGLKYPPQWEGGRLCQKITVKNDEVTEIIMSNK